MKGRIWGACHALLWMAASAAAAGRYALAPGVLGAALGAFLGVPGGAFLARTRLRTWAIPALAAAAGAASLAGAALLGWWPLPARLLGPRSLYLAAELVPATLIPFAGVAALEALARRSAAWRLAGLAVLAALFASLFAAHREGYLNRPYFLVDPLWSGGLDPLPWFLFLGLVLTALMAVVLAGSQASRRAVAGVAVLVAALAALFLALPQRHLKQITELRRAQGQGAPDQGEAGREPPGSGKVGEGKDQGNDPGKDGGGQRPPEDFKDQSSQPSDAPLAVVVFHNDYTPPLGWYYFRETAFSTYNGARLVQDDTQRFDRDLARSWTGKLPAARGEEVRTTVAVMAPHAKPFGLVSPVAFKETGNPDPRRFFGAYDVVSMACATPPRELLERDLGDPAWDEATRKHYLEGPSDPRYQALAEEIVSGLDPARRDKPFARAVAIKLWMDRNTIYSLSTTHGDSPDPLGDFLFGDRRGHCVYLAHAACLLFRAAGLPARVGAGYAANPDFRYGGASLMLRASNAHAWPEIRVQGLGWMPLDITPALSEVPPQEAPDKDLQQMLGEMALSEKPPPPPPPGQGAPPLGERLEFLARILGWILLAAALAALPACYAVRFWRARAPYFGRAGDVPRTAYRAALDAAAARGWRRGPGETREAFARRLAQVSPAFGRLTALHLRWALGPRGEPPRAEACRELLAAARAEFRASTPPRRRFLSALDPLAWARAR